MNDKTKECLAGRTIVGFDLRKKSTLTKVFMTSYDEGVRYEDIYDKFQKYQSGLNLFIIDPSCIASLKIPSDAQIIAFDLPTDLVESLSNGNLSSPTPLPEEVIIDDWIFVGFDIVDPITQTSIFHGFTPPIFTKELIENLNIDFNQNGLLEKMDVARRIAKTSDELIPEHAPFSPCGIWLKPAL